MSRKIEQYALLLLGTAAAVGVAGACAVFVAWRLGSPYLALGGTVLILFCPALAVVSTAVSRPAGDDRNRLLEVERALRFTRGARALALLGFSYAAVLWICQVGGLIDAKGAVAAYSLITFVAVAAYLPWMARREKKALELRAALCRALNEFKAGRNWDVE